MNKGFTLLELIVVIIIIGILATLGFTQYTRVVEKGRTAEARMILGQLRTAQVAYEQEYGTTTDNMTNLVVEAPEDCTGTTHYFSYSCLPSGTCTAQRCTGSSGKTPGAAAPGYNLTMTTLGVLTSPF